MSGRHVDVGGGQRLVLASSETATREDAANAKLVVTSPPYFDVKDYGHADQIGVKGESYAQYIARLTRVWTVLGDCTADDAVLVVNVANIRRGGLFYPIGMDIRAAMGSPWELWDEVVWHVPNALPQPSHYRGRLPDNKWERVLVFTKGGVDTGYTFHEPRVEALYASVDPRGHKFDPAGRGVGNVVRIPAYRPPNIRSRGYHVAAFPDELAAWAVETFTDPGDVVVDPFVGSGTVLKACRWLGRRGVGFEVNPAFVDLVQARVDEPWAEPQWDAVAGLPAGRAGVRRPTKPDGQGYLDL